MSTATEVSPVGRQLIETITSDDPALRDRSVHALLAGRSTREVLDACEDLEAFRWLLEELRVSLFAPELKTPIPVSPQRVVEQWADLTR